MLNLSLQFDDKKKYLLCGELVKFHLKITSPDYDSSNVTEFMERIGATVEGIEVIEDSLTLKSTSTYSSSSGPSGSLYSLKGKKMTSAESLSNFLKSSTRNNENLHYQQSSHSRSKDSQNSQCSMSSVTARRFNSLRRAHTKPFWSSEEEAILIPLEAFIDPECLSSTCNKAAVKIKVSLNELIPIEIISNFLTDVSDCVNSKNSHKLQKIGQTEVSLTVLRPLEVSLRTHSISSTQSIIQLSIEFNDHDFTEGTSGKESKLNLEIENVEIFISNSNVLTNSDFKIVPMSPNQVPFTFETCPQQHCLLFNWSLLKELNSGNFEFNDYRARVEILGRVKDSNCNIFSLSFESSIPNNFLTYEMERGIQITSVKFLNDKINLFEPFQIEFIIHNFTEEMKPFLNLDFTCERKPPKSPKNQQLDAVGYQVKEWFRIESLKKSPNILLMNPLDLPLKIEKLPAGGSKSVRLKFVPVKSGFFDLKDELKIIADGNLLLKYESIIINVE